MKHKISTTVLNSFVILGILLTFFALAVTPIVLTAFFKSSDFKPATPYAVVIGTVSIYACATPYVIGLFKLKKVCTLLQTEDAISVKIARKFFHISICAFMEAAVYLIVQAILILKFNVFLLALTVIPLFVFPFVCIVIGFLAFVISAVFKKAAEIKEENDATF